jgi:membrane-associated phospholipid phosphatase
MIRTAAPGERGPVPLAPPWSGVAILLSVAMTAALTVMVWHSHSLPEVDNWVLLRVAAQGDRDLAQHVTRALTAVTIAAAVALVAYAFCVLRRVDAAGLALLSPVITLVAERGLKSIVARRAPGSTVYHFPSGHVAVATTVVISVVLIGRSAMVRFSRWLGLSLAASVLLLSMMWSRMADTAHLFTDVVAGVGLGTTVTLLVALALDRADRATAGTV